MPPAVPGVSVLFTEPAGNSPNYAFICRVANLRARRQAWEFHFRNRHKRDYLPVVARNMPDLDGNHWRFRYWEGDKTTTEKITDYFRLAGYEILSTEHRQSILTHAGKTGTFADLCREFGVNYQKAWYRLNRRGATIAEIFGGKA